MSETKTTLTWLLRDEVSGTARKINGEFDKMHQKSERASKGGLSSLGGSLAGLISPATLAIGAVVGIAGALTEMTLKAEKGQVVTARLDAALKANVKGWKGQKEAIDKSVQAGINHGFENDELEASFAQLVTATKSVGKSQRDVALAQDLARAKGIDLGSATQILVAVEAHRFRGLAQLGIATTKTTTVTQALQKVQQATAGQADAYGKTVSGAFAKINAKIDAAQEKIGEALLPAFASVATFIADQLLPAIGNAGTAFGKFIDEVSKNEDVLNFLGKSGDVIAKAWDDVTTAISGAAGAFHDFANELNKNTGVIDWMDALGNLGVSTIGSGVDAFLGKKKPSPKVAGHHASGGWVGMNGPEFGIVGESGPEYITPARSGGGPGGGFTIVGVSEAQIVAMVDRGLYFKLARASASATRK